MILGVIVIHYCNIISSVIKDPSFLYSVSLMFLYHMAYLTDFVVEDVITYTFIWDDPS